MAVVSLVTVPFHLSRAVCSRGEAERALSDNRDRYIAQSAATEAGRLAEPPPVKNWTDEIPKHYLEPKA